MASTKFSDMEIDAIGEIMNISLGASATAVSNLLGAQTNITTPVVKVQTKKSFQFKDLEPAIGVAISYTEGLSGRNIMLFSRRDVRIIVGMMMQMEIPEDQFEMDEMNKSAICEVMNQMMGSAATALSEFLGYTVNISTPQSFEIGNEKDFKDEYFPGNEQYVVVRFTLEVGDKISSEFMNIMTVDLAKKMIEPFRDSMGIPDGNAESTEQKTDAGEESSAPEAQPQESTAPEVQPQESAAPEAQPQESVAVEDPIPQMPPAGGVLNQAETDALIAKAKGMSAGNRPMTQEEMDAILAKTRAEMADAQLSAADEQPASTGSGTAAAPAAEEKTPAQPASAEISAASAGTASAGVSAASAGTASAGGPPASADAQSQSAQMPQGTAFGAAAGASAMEPMMMQLLNSMQQSQAQMLELIRDMRAGEEKRSESPQPAPGTGKRENTVIRSANSQTFPEDEKNAAEVPENREMLMKVPLELSVEIGRTMKPVREILELTQGSLVVLDKMAGEQADLYVNGECIAKGDIVVVEDNFGIRITEIINKDIYQEKLSS